MDEELVHLINKQQDVDPLCMTPEELDVVIQQITHQAYPKLASISPASIRARFLLLKFLNQRLFEMINTVDLRAFSEEYPYPTLASKLLEIKSLLFTQEIVVYMDKYVGYSLFQN